MRKLIALKTIGILALLLSFGLVRGQSSAPIHQSKVLSPQDEAQVLQNKEAWIAAHPIEYKRLTGHYVTPEENAKQALKEKEAYYAAHPANNARQGASTLPWGAPENKAAWVANHAREYEHMSASPVDTRTRISRTEFDALPAAKRQAISNDPNHVIVETTSTK